MREDMEPKVVVLDSSKGRFGGIGDKMLIPSPGLVKEMVGGLDSGETMDSAELRRRMADRFEAKFACPMTTGIMLRIVSEAAWDEHLSGAPLEAIAPFWRAVDPKSPLAKKLACGQEWLVEMRAKEGIA